eukprot:1948117-Pyramimonas_sp.AAC.1
MAQWIRECARTQTTCSLRVLCWSQSASLPVAGSLRKLRQLVVCAATWQLVGRVRFPCLGRTGESP